MLGLLLCVIGCAGGQHKAADLPLAPPDMLLLDAADPVVTMTVAGRPLRLLVDPAQSDAIELDPTVARALPVRWTQERDLEIGRVLLKGRTAETSLQAGGRTVPILVSTHDRPIGQPVDGLIGPDLLPYAIVRWQRPGAPPPTATITLPLTLDTGLGLVTRDPALPLPIRVRFTQARADSEATAAAASLLVQRYGGRFESIARDRPVFLGVSRPTRSLLFDRAPSIAGFRFQSLSVRISDFRGANPLPADPGEAGEIVVSRREPPQPAQSWVTIAADRLSRCADVTYFARPRTLSLSCAFDP